MADGTQPMALTNELGNDPGDAIRYSLANARSIADLLATAASSTGVDFEELREDTVFNLGSMLLGLIEDALAKLEQCEVTRKEDEPGGASI